MKYTLRGRSILAAVGLAAGSFALVVSTAGAAAAPTVVVKPDTGLAKQANVHVSGQHYKAEAGQTVYVVECVNTATNANGCDIAGVETATITATGSLPSTKIRVFEKFTNGGGTTSKCNASGTATGGCVIEVASQSQAPLGASPISFAS
jgi:Neocarzinostatin family